MTKMLRRRSHVVKRGIRQMRSFGVAAIFLCVFAISLEASAQDCSALYQYRDTALPKVWDAAVQRLRIRNDTTKKLQSMKAELESIKIKNTTDLALFKDSLAGIIATTSDLVSGLLSLNPETGVVNVVISSSAGTAEHILEGIEEGKQINSLINEEFSMAALKIALSKGNLVEKSLGVILSLKDNIRNLMVIGSESEKLRQLLDNQINSINLQLLKYDADIAKSRKDIEFVNNAVFAIDSFCSSKIAGKWHGAGGSGSVRFSGRCTWQTVMTITEMEVVIGATGGISSAKITASHDEGLLGGCDLKPIGQQAHVYTLQSGQASAGGVSMAFNGSNNTPPTIASYTGSFSGGILRGTVTFKRHDALSGPLEWTISVPQNLQKG